MPQIDTDQIEWLARKLRTCQAPKGRDWSNWVAPCASVLGAQDWSQELRTPTKLTSSSSRHSVYPDKAPPKGSIVPDGEVVILTLSVPNFAPDLLISLMKATGLVQDDLWRRLMKRKMYSHLGSEGFEWSGASKNSCNIAGGCLPQAARIEIKQAIPFRIHIRRPRKQSKNQNVSNMLHRSSGPPNTSIARWELIGCRTGRNHY